VATGGQNNQNKILQMTKMQSIIKTCLEGKPSDVGLDNWPDFAWEMQSRALEEIKQQAINFAESIEFSKYEKFEGQENLWYDKNSTHYNPILAKTTEQLWKEYCAKLIRENLTK